jgi:protein-tyrosine phosphatase
MKVNVLFACLGNICRSPTAHGLFQYHVDQANLSDSILVDSAGTGAWHVGEPPDRRAQSAALNKGYDIGHLRGRCVESHDFLHFDYILAMDYQNLHDLQKVKPDNYKGVLGLFLMIADGMLKDRPISDKTLEVPDPFYGDSAHFKKAIALIDNGSKNLLDRIRENHDI